MAKEGTFKIIFPIINQRGVWNKAKATLCNIFMRLQCNSQKGNPKVLKGSPKKLQKRLQKPATKTVWTDFIAQILQENVRNVTTIFSNVFVFEIRTFLEHSNVFFQNKELQTFFVATLQKLSGGGNFTIALQPRDKTPQCSLSLKFWRQFFSKLKFWVTSLFIFCFWEACLCFYIFLIKHLQVPWSLLTITQESHILEYN